MIGFDPTSAFIGGGLSLLGTLGQDEGSPSTSQSGFLALPPWLQDLYRPYAEQLQEMYRNPEKFNAPGLNQEQEQAYQGQAHPDFSDGSLANYMKPYELLKQQRSADIQQRGDFDRMNLLRQFGGRNGGRLDSSLAYLANSANKNTQQQQDDLNAEFQLQALALRDQALQHGLNYGNAQYGVQAQNSPYGQFERYRNSLSSVPNAMTQTGATGPTTNAIGHIANVAGGAIVGGGGIPGLSQYINGTGGQNSSGLPGNTQSGSANGYANPFSNYRIPGF